jgi:hypothetical protein
MVNQFGIEWFGDLADDQNSEGYDLFRVEGREGSEDFVWAVQKLDREAKLIDQSSERSREKKNKCRGRRKSFGIWGADVTGRPIFGSWVAW